MSFEQRSLGKRSQPQTYNNSNGHKDGSSFTRKREQKEMAGRETSDTLYNQCISGTGVDPSKTGAYDNYPDIPERSVTNLISKGYKYLFPVQQACFKPMFERKDVIARDLTGSGKTLAFGLPIIEYLRKNKLFGTGQVQAIMLAPTRELALQITNELTKLKYSPEEFRIVTVYGGVSVADQARQLKNGVDLFVGTTGRVKDHIERGNIEFESLKFMILDETDVMLKQGFKEDVDQILSSCRETCDKENLQICLFSATIPDWVREIAREHMKPNYEFLNLCKDLSKKTATNINHLAIECPWHDRLDALSKVLNCYGGTGRIIVFSSTKADANSLLLSDKITHDVEVMHGDIAQNQREVTIKRFKDFKFQVLVATDVASRGLDIPNVELVIQLEPPKDTESYIHRSGRTARAGKHGTCITFFNRRNEEFVDRIESLAGVKLERVPVPTEEDMLKAKNKDVLKKLADVETDVLPDFEEAARIFIKDCGNDPVKAVKMCLAYCAGHTKQTLPTKSLLNGRDGFTTIKMSVEEGNQLEENLVTEILNRYWNPRTASQVKNMKAIADDSGVVFDLRTDQADAFMDNYEHLKATQGRKVDFECTRCKTLPQLKGGNEAGSHYSRNGGGGSHRRDGNNDRGFGGGGRGFGGGRDRSNGNDRGGNDRGWGGGGGSKRQEPREDNRRSDNNNGGGGASGGWGGGAGWNKENYNPRPSYNTFESQKQTNFNGFDSTYPTRGSTSYTNDDDPMSERSDMLYLGNIPYEANEMEVMKFLSEGGFKPLRGKLNMDRETGKSKGCAFVQMSSIKEAERAIMELQGNQFQGREMAIRFKTNKA